MYVIAFSFRFEILFLVTLEFLSREAASMKWTQLYGSFCSTFHLSSACRAWNIFCLMSYILCGKDTSVGSGRTAGGAKLWEVSRRGCRLPSFFPGCLVLQSGYRAKQTVAVAQSLHWPHSYRWSILLSALPTSTISSLLLLQECICSFEGEGYHLLVSLLRYMWKWVETIEAMMSFVFIGRRLL